MVFQKSRGQDSGVPQTSVKFFQTRIMVVSEEDRHIWSLVTEVPKLSLNHAYACALLNIFLPGVGTLVAACSGDGVVSKT